MTGKGGRVTLWNPQTLAPAGELEGMRNVSQALAFSPDGARLAGVEAIASEETLSGKPRPLRVWDLRSRTLTDFRAQTAANLLAYSPDGRLLAAATQERGTEIRDASTGQADRASRVAALARATTRARSSSRPDGELLFARPVQRDRTAVLDRFTGGAVGQPLEGAHTGRITFGAFTPDGKTLVTSGADGRVVLWDVERQAQIGAPLEFAPNTFASVALSPDGSRLFAVSSRGEGISFDMSHEAWKRHACLVAGRELTQAEWSEVLPERPYQAVCSAELRAELPGSRYRPAGLWRRSTAAGGRHRKERQMFSPAFKTRLATALAGAALASALVVSGASAHYGAAAGTASPTTFRRRLPRSRSRRPRSIRTCAPRTRSTPPGGGRAV